MVVRLWLLMMTLHACTLSTLQVDDLHEITLYSFMLLSNYKVSVKTGSVSVKTGDMSVLRTVFADSLLVCFQFPTPGVRCLERVLSV